MRTFALLALLAATFLGAEEISFTAKDGVQLSGTLTVTDKKAGTVICLPMYRSERSAYAPLVTELTQRGLNAFAIDLRGHGKSSPELAKRVQARDAEVFNAMYLDVFAALDVLAKQGLDTKRVAVIGASVGCSVAIDATTRRPEAFRAMVLLTPGANYLGVNSLDHAKRWKGLPTSILTSAEESSGVRPVHAALKAASKDVTLRVIEDTKGIHGTRMFGKVPQVEAELAAFLAAHLE